jgi:hypothetical protein
MFHRLHERQTNKGSAVRGLSCDESGVHFGGDCALVTADADTTALRTVLGAKRALRAISAEKAPGVEAVFGLT